MGLEFKSDSTSNKNESKKEAIVNKVNLLNECSVFTKAPIDTKSCIKLITRILRFLDCGNERLLDSEKSEIFFSVTRLFESTSERLRRLVYILIKSLGIGEGEIFIIISSLTKDINSSNSIYRANAIRLLYYIVNDSSISQIERYLKASLVDSDPYVASSAIICCIKLYDKVPNTIRRWFSEVSSCLTSPHDMIRFHSFILLLLCKSNDKLTIRKYINQLMETNLPPILQYYIIKYLRANIATDRCLDVLIAYVNNLLNQDLSPLVHLECIKVAVSLCSEQVGDGSYESAINLNRCIEFLHSGLSMKDDVVVYACLKQLSIISLTHPNKVYHHQIQIFLDGPNTNISSLALITLINIGNKGTIDNLLEKLGNISGDFRSSICNAITNLCTKYPTKYKQVFKYYITSFREESNKELKFEIAKSTIYIIENVGEAIEEGLVTLCEFIEDCEYPEVTTMVLKFLGDNVAGSPNPKLFIRYIYNRILLEDVGVRLASIYALDMIGKMVPGVRQAVVSLLKPCLYDGNEIVREIVHQITRQNEGVDLGNQATRVKLDVESQKSGKVDQGREPVDLGRDPPSIKLDLKSQKSDKLGDPLRASIDSAHNILGSSQMSLEHQQSGVTHDIDSLVQTLLEMVNEERFGDEVVVKQGDIPTRRSVSIDESVAGDAMEICMPDEVMEYLGTGGSEVIPTSTAWLTEEEEDYSVRVEAFIVKDHLTEDPAKAHRIILKYVVRNNLQDQIMQNVNVNLMLTSDKWNCIATIPVEEIEANSLGHVYSIYQMKDSSVTEVDLLVGTFKVELTFRATSHNTSRSFEESIQVNDLTLNLATYLTSWKLGKDEFKSMWDDLADGANEVATFVLEFKTMEDAVFGVARYLGLEKSLEMLNDLGDFGGMQTLKLKLAGIFLGTSRVMFNVALAHPSPNQNVLLKLAVRSQHKLVPEFVFKLFE